MALRSSSRRDAITTRPTPYVAGRHRRPTASWAHEIERSGFAVAVESFQNVVEEKLAGTEGGKTWIVADLVGKTNVLGAVAVHERQHPTVQSQSGGLELAHRASCSACVAKKSNMPGVAEHRRTRFALPTEILDLERLAQPRFDVCRSIWEDISNCRLPSSASRPRGSIHRLTMVLRQLVLIGVQS